MSTSQYSQDQLQMVRKAISRPANSWERAVKEMYRVVAQNLSDKGEYPSVATFSGLRQNLNESLDKQFDTSTVEGIVCYLAWQAKSETPKNAHMFRHFRLVAWFAGLAVGIITYPLFGDYRAVFLGIGVSMILTLIWFLKLNK